MASPAERASDDQESISLPLDALRKVLSCLDSHFLSRCSCVSRAWNALASEDALWQQQLKTEFYRPEILQPYSLLSHRAHQMFPSAPAGTAAASPQESASARSRRQDAPGALKQVFANSAALPVCQHQALLSRFHTAMRSIHAWRLVIKLRPIDAPVDNYRHEALAPAQRCAAAREAATGSSCDPPPTQHIIKTDNSSSASSNSSSSRSCQGDAAGAAHNPHSPKPLTGYPARLDVSDFISGVVAGWCCGCVLVQHQEQSCWVRFRLPAELKTDAFLNGAAAGFGSLVACVQALGPCGWFDVASCDPFTLEDDDMDILLQSHKTGFYAWDQSEEDGPAKDGDLTPLPWDMTEDNWQQVLQEERRQQQQQQAAAAASNPGQADQSLQLQQQAAVAPHNPEQEDQYHTNQQQQQQAVVALPNLGQADQSDRQRQPATAAALNLGHTDLQPQPDLRMLVYIHYEQLLQSLTWQLPQALPIAKPPAIRSMAAVGRHLTNGPAAAAALWLHIDVCQLHGGFRLGSCVAPLVLVRMGPQKVVFEADPESVLVALYDPHSEKNSSSSDCSAQQQQQQQFGVLADEACKLLLLGKQCIGGSSSSKGVYSSEGLLIEAAADALGDLMGRDEVMVDFALFDGQGHLLMGRAGVEVWSKECTSYHTPQQQQEHHAHNIHPEQQQDTPPLEQQDNQPHPYQHQHHHQHQQQVEAALPPVAAAAAAGNAAPVAGPIVHSRQLHMLHFLIDHVHSELWENGITVDTAAAPEGVRVPLVSLALTWAALKGLFMKPTAEQQHAAGGGGLSGDAIDDDVYAVGEAMLAMMG